MTNEEAHRLELQMAGLQRTVETGFATVRGDLNLLARGEQLNISETQKHDVRIQALEDRRFPLQIVSGVVSVAAVGLAAVSLLKGG